MVMALFILALILYLIQATNNKIKSLKPDKVTRNLIIFVLLTTLVQVVLGTQVRQFVDVQTDIYGEDSPNLWLHNATLSFYMHRSFSIIVVLLNLALAIRIYNLNLGYSKIKWVLAILLLEVISGMAMYYLDFPFASQPLHLVLASVLFGFQFYLVLEALNAFKTMKTL
jgi:cytochrome c oxidase assembly protein subunit 15